MNFLAYIGAHPLVLPILVTLLCILWELGRRNKRTGGDS